jgi:hypothetical protein
VDYSAECARSALKWTIIIDLCGENFYIRGNSRINARLYRQQVFVVAFVEGCRVHSSRSFCRLLLFPFSRKPLADVVSLLIGQQPIKIFIFFFFFAQLSTSFGRKRWPTDVQTRRASCCRDHANNNCYYCVERCVC